MRWYKLCIFAVLLPLNCFAQRSTEPRDFRGIEWDTYYSAVPGMVKQYSKDEKIDVFKRTADEMNIGSCKLDTLTYETFNGRVYKVNMTFSTCDPSAVFNDFKHKYDECSNVDESLDYFICTWDWKRVKIIFSIDSASGATSINYTYKMTEREYETYLKEKAGQKKDLF